MMLSSMCRNFQTELMDKLFQNTYGFANDEAGRAKGLGADYADRLFNMEGVRVRRSCRPTIHGLAGKACALVWAVLV